jgi:hypothetical protein
MWITSSCSLFEFASCDRYFETGCQIRKYVVLFAYIVIVPVRWQLCVQNCPFEGYRCDIIECFKGERRKGDKGTKGINELKKWKIIRENWLIVEIQRQRSLAGSTHLFYFLKEYLISTFLRKLGAIVVFPWVSREESLCLCGCFWLLSVVCQPAKKKALSSGDISSLFLILYVYYFRLQSITHRLYVFADIYICREVKM